MMKHLTQPILSLFLLLILASCSDSPTDLVKPAINNSPAVNAVSASVTKNQISADNYSTAEITVTIKDYDPAINGNLQVSLTTDKGTFSNGTTAFKTSASSDGSTVIYLKNNLAETAAVNIAVSNNFVKTLAVNFVPAFPDQILLDPTVATLPVSGNTTIGLKGSLIKTNGIPSNGQYLTWYDSTATDGRSIGTFIKMTPSDASGAASSSYTLQDTTYRGYLYLKAFSQNDPRKIKGTTRILITK